MRNIILLLALFAGTAFAQAPVIDSMLIDESKGILSVYGDFGTAQGKVWCDSVELSILTWSNSLVTATIPDTGKGSAGRVTVQGSGNEIDSGLLSYWHVKFIYQGNNVGAKYSYSFDYDLVFRADIQSRILHKQYVHPIPLVGMISSRCSQSCTGSSYSANPFRFYGDLFLDYSNVYINLDLHVCSSYGKKYLLVDFDSTFRVKKGFFFHHGAGDPTHWDDWYELKSDFLPSSDIVHLVKYPTLRSPYDMRNDLGTNDLLLTWDTLKYFDTYRVQLFSDSLDNKHDQAAAYIVDTVVGAFNFQLPHLAKTTKYYWRVCGVNAEGEGQWSSVWSFTTGINADVKQEQVKRTSLACYPNPAMKELAIVTTEPTRLLLYDVTGKIVKSEQATSGETKWDVSLLPNGTYILGTSSGQMQVVQIVK